jgi:hypothetical protein
MGLKKDVLAGTRGVKLSTVSYEGFSWIYLQCPICKQNWSLKIRAEFLMRFKKEIIKPACPNCQKRLNHED